MPRGNVKFDIDVPFIEEPLAMQRLALAAAVEALATAFGPEQTKESLPALITLALPETGAAR